MRRALISAGLSSGIALVAIAASMGMLAAFGYNAGEATTAFFEGAFGDRSRIAGTAAKMVPLTLVALAWVVAFTAGRINVGLEGQALMGGAAAGFFALQAPGLPAWLHLPLAVAAGVAGGAAFAGVAAWLWARRRVNEIISTLLLNLVAIQVVSWLVRGPLQEPTRSLAQTSPLPASARWARLLPGMPLSWDVLLALTAVGAVALLLHRTTLGFRLRLVGANAEAARHAGIATTATGVIALLLSGGLAGLAGSSLVLAGESGSMTDDFSANYGFEGIVVALLARNAPLACVPAALLLAALRQGGGLMEARVGIPSALVLITQGTVILLLSGASFLLDWRRAARIDPLEPAAVERRRPAGTA